MYSSSAFYFGNLVSQNDPTIWHLAHRPIIALSPMADMTDSAFCRVVKEVTDPKIGLIMFREMVSAEAVVRGNEKTLDMTAIHPAERPLVQQIFGSNPETMAEAAVKIAAEHQPEGFDINMGCPVYKIVHQFNGASLMREPELAEAIVRQMKKVISVPLSVKIRLGWADPNECLDFIAMLEQAGADLVTIHGRTKTQGYSGVADWLAVGAAKRRVKIPVLCNGDIHTADRASVALAESGCDGLLIARGALGNPWIFNEINGALAGREVGVISWTERLEVMKRHLKYHLEQYGPGAVPTFRKHMSWYLKGLPNIRPRRDALMKAITEVELIEQLELIPNLEDNGLGIESTSVGEKIYSGIV